MTDLTPETYEDVLSSQSNSPLQHLLMNLSQCSLRQSLVFHCSWSPEGCKDWMPLSALGQAPHHLKCQLKKAKKSCEYVWSMDKVKDIPHHMGVVGGGWFGRIGTRKSKWRLWHTYKSTVEDSAFQLQSLTHPSPIKTILDILPSPPSKIEVFWPFRCISHQFVTLNLEHISEYLSEKLQKYCKSHMAVFCFLKEI